MSRRKRVNFYSNHRYPLSKADKEREKLRNQVTVRGLVDDLYEVASSIKRESGCKICQEKAECCLSFHHLDPAKKDFDVSSGIRKGYSRNKVLKEIAKCVVLCENCHRKLHNRLVSLPEEFDLVEDADVVESLNLLDLMEDMEDNEQLESELGQ